MQQRSWHACGALPAILTPDPPGVAVDAWDALRRPVPQLPTLHTHVLIHHPVASECLMADGAVDHVPAIGGTTSHPSQAFAIPAACPNTSHGFRSAVRCSITWNV